MQRYAKIIDIGMRLGFCMVLFAGIFLFAGFLRFTFIIDNYDNSRTLNQLPANVDAIVVLTGGQSRIETGLQLLENNHAKRLLISGVHPGTRIGAISARFAAHTHLFDCCIDLDHVAKNTLENGSETRNWMVSNSYRDLIVVTSDYHMPRSIVVLANAMPEVLLYPYVAEKKKPIAEARINDANYLRIVIVEYFKSLAITWRRFS